MVVALGCACEVAGIKVVPPEDGEDVEAAGGMESFSGVCGGVGRGVMKNGCCRAARAVMRLVGLNERNFSKSS